uniref:Uncharacterized protein n=1 Tax=Glossina palpalis gambiensis TaxID=67801 RepID=A0A1B0C231_9MUSC
MCAILSDSIQLSILESTLGRPYCRNFYKGVVANINQVSILAKIVGIYFCSWALLNMPAQYRVIITQVWFNVIFLVSAPSAIIVYICHRSQQTMVNCHYNKIAPITH